MSVAPSEPVDLGVVELAIVGIAQDGGVPQAGCACKNCRMAMEDPSRRYFPSSCAIRGKDGSLHIIEATRSLAEQIVIASKSLRFEVSVPETVSLTHTHLGHVDGLGQFGKEVIDSKDVPLFGSEKVLLDLKRRRLVDPFSAKTVTPMSFFSPKDGCGFEYMFIPVPHRDEYSDTHAIVIKGDEKSILFIPDHDDWDKTLNLNGFENIREWWNYLEVDIILLDGTFWNEKEIEDRDISEIPHPMISETIERIGHKLETDPELYFIHINHTNPILDENSPQYQKIIRMGWRVARQGGTFVL
ncbi:MAG: hypothetical protein CMA12_01990 [Euryarchaeota archaeon]|nr:hypothetical protein [Euryarchaeota archaeon]OUW22814.1 MAG: hypothetical protein CBD33_00565 [Euryarchaeota archaeon TMED173]